MENLGFEGKLCDGSVSGENVIKLFKKTMFFFSFQNSAKLQNEIKFMKRNAPLCCICVIPISTLTKM